MKPWKRNGILAAALLVFGAARLPFEAGLARELRAARLTAPDLDIGTKERIGQTSAVVALGGLRTLVATFMNLRAFAFFEETRWDDVADTYDTIVNLAPHTSYYWDSGHWHQAYNAASYYLNDEKLTPLRRKVAWRASIVRGRAFLERGIRNNPGNWVLWKDLGDLLTFQDKFTAFPDPDKTFADAAEAYHQAEINGAPQYALRFQLYALARVHGREKEALEMARNLYAEERNRTPTLLSMLFVLEAHENPDMDLVAKASEIFGSPDAAYKALADHWLRTRERFPVFGVARTLQLLETLLKVPAENSVLKK